MNINLFVKTYVLGNEDARAFQDEGLFELAEKRGYKRGTDEFDWFVGGGAAFRFFALTVTHLKKNQKTSQPD